MAGTAKHRCRVHWDHEQQKLHWDGVPNIEHWRHAEGDYELRFQGLALDRYRMAVLIEPIYDHFDPRYTIPGVESSVRGWYQIASDSAQPSGARRRGRPLRTSCPPAAFSTSCGSEPALPGGGNPKIGEPNGSCSLRILVKTAICPHPVPTCDPELEEIVLRPPPGVEPVQVDCDFALVVLKLGVTA